ncbi:MAG: hypothetical protein K5778_01655 [Bacteroidaceae bacterium]|nr:hypothetical protein [Bacteroidaceae bacterium]
MPKRKHLTASIRHAAVFSVMAKRKETAADHLFLMPLSAKKNKNAQPKKTARGGTWKA